MVYNVQSSGSCQSTQTINKLDLSGYFILEEVVGDAIDRLSNDTTHLNLSLLMNEYKGGTLVKAMKTDSDALEERDNWEGYFEVNGKVVAVDFGASHYRPIFIYPSDPLIVSLERFEDNAHILDIKYYYVLDDEYAIYDPNEGWIWSDRKPDE